MLGSHRADIPPRPPHVTSFRAFHLAERHLQQILQQAVVPVFAVADAELWSATRGSPTAAFARQAAMYLAHVGCGLNFSEVGRLFARDRTTVAHACELIEQRREDPVFDRSLELLESAMRLFSPLPFVR